MMIEVPEKYALEVSSPAPSCCGLASPTTCSIGFDSAS